MEFDERTFREKVKRQSIEANAENMLAVCLWAYDQCKDKDVAMDWYNRLHDFITEELQDEDDKEHFDHTVFLYLSESQPEWWTLDEFPGPVTRIITYSVDDEATLH